MANPLARLKAFAATKQGKIALGGTAVVGVVGAGLATRRKAGGDPTGDVSSAPPFATAPASGTGVNSDVFPNMNGDAGVDVGQFESLIQNIGRLADAYDERNNTGTVADPPASSGLTNEGILRGVTKIGLQRIGQVGTNYNAREIAAQYSPSSNPDAIEVTLRQIVALNPMLEGKTEIPGGFPLNVPMS
jgi:hypothetical protein